MKLTLTLVLLPAALAWPSYNGHAKRHDHGHKAHKSGQLPSSGALVTGSPEGPYGLSNATASQAATAIGSADSLSSTGYLTLYSTIYQNAGPSQAADTGSGGAACAGTVTVTQANTVTVTVSGGQGSQAATAVPETQTPVTPNQAPLSSESLAPAAPVTTSSVPKPVAPIAQSSAPVADNTAVASNVASPAVRQAGGSSSSGSSASAPQSKSAASPPGSKRGLFIPVSADSTQADYVKAFNDHPGKISWIVNQFSGPPGQLSSSFNYVPQCYDKFSDEKNQWTTNAKKALATGTEKYFLSFGEPNTNNSQNLYMDAATGAQTFMTMLQPYATNYGITIGSPGTLGSPEDIQWQNDFLDHCAGLGCKIGWVSAHWFSPCGHATPQDLAKTFWGTIDTYKQIAQSHSSQYGGNLKVWVDNFSLNCDSKTISAFLDIVVPQMDADDMIERYGYVSMTEINQANGFLNTDGSISDLGKHYADM